LRKSPKGTADAYSDLDFYLVTTDEAYEDFNASREAFVRLLGEPVFLEDFDLPNIVFFIFSDGTEGELSLDRESQFNHKLGEPNGVLLDKKNLLAGAVFPGDQPAQAEQMEVLRRLLKSYERFSLKMWGLPVHEQERAALHEQGASDGAAESDEDAP